MSTVAPCQPQNSSLPICLFENPYRLVNGWAGVMTTVVKRHTSGEINRAGKILSSLNAGNQDVEHAIEVMDNWRLSHTYPLDIAQRTLDARARAVSAKPAIGTRLKREASIRAKLVREPYMQLSTMQDIGGCRVIVRCSCPLS